MKYHTPEISWHLDIKPVLSVDVSPDGRIVTGGADNRVCIWKQLDWTDNPSNNTKQSQHSANVEFRASLSLHTEAVNVVKFSPDGSMLATASDDHWLMIWKRNTEAAPGTSSDANNAFSGSVDDDGLEQKEQWDRVLNLRGHLTEVYDLQWSPCSKYIISGSVDGSVILWDVQQGRPLQPRIDEHTGYVQGVAWDPLMRYVVSFSTDKSCRVYKLRHNKPKHRQELNYQLSHALMRRDVRKIAGIAPAKPVTAVGPATTTDAQSGAASTYDVEANDPRKIAELEVAGANGAAHHQMTHQMFVDETVGTFFRRLAFSPDGTYLSIPMAQYVEMSSSDTEDKENLPSSQQSNDEKQAPKPTAPADDKSLNGSKPAPCLYLFHRNDWKAPVAYIPLPEHATCIRWNPLFYQRRTAVPKRSNSIGLTATEPTPQLTDVWYRMVYAVACMRSIFIYDTESTHAIAHFSNLHFSNITDLVWSHDGRQLIASSNDGYCSFFQFAEGELGQSLQPIEMLEVQQTLLEVQKRNVAKALNNSDKKPVTAATTDDKPANDAPTAQPHIQTAPADASALPTAPPPSQPVGTSAAAPATHMVGVKRKNAPTTAEPTQTAPNHTNTTPAPSISATAPVTAVTAAHTSPNGALKQTKLLASPTAQPSASPTTTQPKQMTLASFGQPITADEAAKQAAASAFLAASQSRPVVVPSVQQVQAKQQPTVQSTNKKTKKSDTVNVDGGSSVSDAIELDKPDPNARFVVEAIVDHRQVGKTIEYRVRWAGYTEANDTWEPKRTLKHVTVFIKYENMLIAQRNAQKANGNGKTVADADASDASPSTSPFPSPQPSPEPEQPKSSEAVQQDAAIIPPATAMDVCG